MTREEAIDVIVNDIDTYTIREGLALNMAIKALEQEQSFEWCTDCKEYDQEKHCCHRWSKVIRDSVEEMKQEYIKWEVLDKLRAELHETAEMHDDGDYYIRDEWIDEYFDKYKVETEAEDGECK